MSKTIDRLRTDHQRLRAVLETISEVSTELQPDDIGSQSDYLFCLVDYLLEYPDRVHHPTEDLVFDRLLDLDLTREQTEKVTRNRSQHNILKAATVELMDLVETSDNTIDSDQFLKKLGEYLPLQLKHMQFEEQEIFPLALEYIPSAVWEELDEHFGESKDPLFDEADRRFAAVYRLIVPDEQTSARMAEPLLRYLTATGAHLNTKG